MNTKTVADLIEQLQDMPQDAQVRLATQPSWPLAFTIGAVTSPEDMAGETECEGHGHYSCKECADDIVWIAAGDHPDGSPYAPHGAWTA